MGSFSDYTENKILDHITGKTSFTMPTIYTAYSTADPLDDNSGIAEPVGNGYTRVETSGSDWDTASAGAISNAAAITFPEASGAQGTITHFAAFDALTGGNQLWHGSLEASRVITSGVTPRFAIGELDITQS